MRRSALIITLALSIAATAGPASGPVRAQEATAAGGQAPQGDGAMAVPADYAFAITRKGNRIGEHHIRFSPTEDGLAVDIDIDIKVSFGPIPLFRYSHDNRELWRDGQLVQITTRTTENGEEFALDGQAQGERFVFKGAEGHLTAPASILPSSYWRRETVYKATLLGTQRGRLLEMQQERVWTDEASGDDCYELSGDLDLTLCYRGERLTQLEFRFDGDEIVYEPLQRPQQGEG